MDIFCHVRPKPALSFAGKYKFVDFCLSNCFHSKIDKVVVLLDYQRTPLKNYLTAWQEENLTKMRIDMLEPEKDGIFSGTANAIYQKLPYLQMQTADNVLIMPSDHAYKMDYRKMLAFHEMAKVDVTVGVVPVPITEAQRFGTLTLDEKGYVVEYIEKPDEPRSNLVSMGIYIFNRDILVKRLIEDAVKAASLHDFGYSIIPEMVGKDRVFGYKYDGYWRDIDTIEAYYETSMELAGKNPPFVLGGMWPILTGENSEPVKK